MPLADKITIAISVSTVGYASANSFGVPLILSANATWTERVRWYTSLAGVGVDFATTTPEYKAAAKVFGQTPKIPRLAIGRRANKPTQRFDIGIVTVRNSTDYTVKVGGNTVTVTSDASALNDEIVDAFVTAINLLTLTTTASAYGAALSKVLRLTGDSAGSWDEVEVPIAEIVTGRLSCVQNHADPDVSADLDAILLETTDFYGVIDPFNSADVVTEISTWCEANSRLYLASTQDSAVITTVDSGATDIAKVTETASQKYTSIWYHPSNGGFIDAALMGKCFALAPGSETWANKVLASVATSALTATHVVNALAKHANVYVDVTENGWASDGTYLDETRFLDWFTARLSSRLQTLISNAAKLPFTEDGFAAVEAEIRAQIRDGIAAGGIDGDTAWAVTVPSLADVPTADRAARLFSGTEFSFRLAGAIHSVDVTGSLTQ